MMDNKLSELKATIPTDKKSREAVAAGFVTDNNSGGYFVMECQECGAVYPSQQADGCEQIADTGDCGDAICPHCGEECPEECVNVGLAWNVQQAKIVALLAELEEMDGKRLVNLYGLKHWQERAQQQEADLADRGGIILELRHRAEAAEKRLATPVRLPNKNDEEFWFGSTFQVAKFDRAVERAISATGFTFTVEGDGQ